MKLREIKNIDQNNLNAVAEVLEDLIIEKLEVDLEVEDLKDVLDIEVTDAMFNDITNLIVNNDEWDYFDVMKILEII